METLLSPLSPEALSLIISFCDDLPSLAKLARVSRHLHQLTLPHLYCHLSLKANFESGTRHLRDVTFLMLRNPETAAMVKHFTLRDPYKTQHFEEPPDTCEWRGWPQHPELDTLLKDAIRIQLGPSTEPDSTPANGIADQTADKKAQLWFKLARAGFNEAATLALLLPNLVNLRTMDVAFKRETLGLGQEAGLEDCTHFLEEMFERATTGRIIIQDRPMFGRLTDIMLIDSDDK